MSTVLYIFGVFHINQSQFLNLEHAKHACRGLVRQNTMKLQTTREMWSLLSKAQEVVCLNAEDQVCLG
jgi:hypothetical protein